ncbi:MAG TPA: hypothetical protein VIE63_09620 [Ramlibacter sp.]|jgi:hypothetical protein
MAQIALRRERRACARPGAPAAVQLGVRHVAILLAVKLALLAALWVAFVRGHHVPVDADAAAARIAAQPQGTTK